jgi:hypothetical protein
MGSPARTSPIGRAYNSKWAYIDPLLGVSKLWKKATDKPKIPTPAAPPPAADPAASYFRELSRAATERQLRQSSGRKSYLSM